VPFVVPLYPHNHKPGWMFRLGMVAYDALSFRKSVPRHRSLGRKAVAVELPSLNRDGLSGALRYYDGQIVFAERLVLETLMSAVDAGATALTYAEVSEVTTDAGRATGVALRDQLTGRDAVVRAGVVVNAAGPWVDEIATGRDLPGSSAAPRGPTSSSTRSRGRRTSSSTTRPARTAGRSLVMPWNGRHLIGTTDDRFEGDLDTTAGTESEIDYLLAETNTLIPGPGSRARRSTTPTRACGRCPTARGPSPGRSRGRT
jgi:glycerol-3-phosphate dehydrogenase